MSARIAIVGGYGAVGRAAARQLHAWGERGLRVGGRRGDAAQQFVAAALSGDVEAARVDVGDRASLERFCAGCEVVVNCAGPSFEILDRVAQVAHAIGAHYVDACGDAPLYAALADRWSNASSALLSAGVLPGLSGLLPRCLANAASGTGLERAHALVAYMGGRDRFTPAAARDYVASLAQGFGQTLAAWRNGQKLARALAPQVDCAVPRFPRRVTAQPFLSIEAERVAQRLGLRDADWYTVFDGEHLPAALRRVLASEVRDADAAERELTRAAELDLAQADPYHVLAFQLDGVRAGRSEARSLVLRGRDVSELTGLATALATRAVLAGEVEPGVHYAAEALDPQHSLERLRSALAVTALEVIDAPIFGASEEGTL